MAQRVTFYIDGFNFYFGLKRSKKIDAEWAKYYWIDMVRLCKSFLGDGQVLEKVIYFTASPLNSQKNSRQSAFLNANKLLNPNRFEVVRGKYMDKQIICPYCKASISRPEEKKTDVNISSRMIEDCLNKKTDVVALVSADSDLIPPMDMIRRNFRLIKIKVYFPPSNGSHDVKDKMLEFRTKPVYMLRNKHRFASAIMPEVVEKDGKRYEMPEKWKNRI